MGLRGQFCLGRSFHVPAYPLQVKSASCFGPPLNSCMRRSCPFRKRGLLDGRRARRPHKPTPLANRRFREIRHCPGRRSGGHGLQATQEILFLSFPKIGPGPCKLFAGGPSVHKITCSGKRSLFARPSARFCDGRLAGDSKMYDYTNEREADGVKNPKTPKPPRFRSFWISVASKPHDPDTN